MTGSRNILSNKYSLCLLLTLIISCGRQGEEITTPVQTVDKHVVKRGENLETILDELSVMLGSHFVGAFLETRYSSLR
jgi:hypothetical protein